MEAPELDAMIARTFSDIERFRINQHGLWTTLNYGCFSAHGLIVAAACHGKHQLKEVFPEMLWQRVLQYQINSLFSLVARNLDEGYAILRLAADLAKDMARLAGAPGLEAVWNNRLKGDGKEAYSKKFHFHPNQSRDEDQVKRLWDLTSKFAIHGHVVGGMASTKVQTDGSIAFLSIPDMEVMKSIRLWMVGFLSVHALCMRPYEPFEGEVKKYFNEIYKPMSQEFAKVTLLLGEGISNHSN